MVSYHWEILSLIYRSGFELTRSRSNLLVHKKINSTPITSWRGKRHSRVVAQKLIKRKKLRRTALPCYDHARHKKAGHVHNRELALTMFFLSMDGSRFKNKPSQRSMNPGKNIFLLGL